MEGTGMISGEPVAVDHNKQESKQLWQYLSSTSACMLAVGAGSALAWPSPVLPQFHLPDSWLETTDEQDSWINSLLAVGAMVGALFSGKMADKLGRKKSLVLLAIPFLLSWTLLVAVSQLWLIFLARFLVGIGVGAACVLVPTYVSEVAEVSARGTLGALFQLFFTVGIVYTFVLGSVLGYTALAVMCGLVEVLFVVTFVWMPESPVWLMNQRRKPDARLVMTVLRGTTYDPSEELADMQQSVDEASASESSIANLFRIPALRRALIISFGCMIFQQLSGINAVISYTFKIFEEAGSSLKPEIASISVAMVQMVMSAVAAVIVDRAGRKPLLLISSSVMSLSLIVLGLYFKLQKNGNDVSSLGWLPLASLTIFMIAFSVGLGPVPWMIMGELFSAETKAVASGMAVMLNWLLVFVVTKTFPAMQSGLGADWTFWLFAAIMAGATVFTIFLVPETKGKSIQEIQEELGRGSRLDKSVG